MDTTRRTSTIAVETGIAAIAALALTAGTYAAFTDSAVGPGGTSGSGTLNLDLTTNPRNTATVLDEPGIYPEKVLKARTVTVHNSGSLNGVLAIGSVLDTHGGQLQDQLTATVTCTSDNPEHAPYSRVDAPLATAFPTTAVPLDADERVICTFRFALPDRPDNNVVQGDSLTIRSTFTLSQAGYLD